MRKILTFFLVFTFLFSGTFTFAFGGWKKGFFPEFNEEREIERMKVMFDRWAKILGIPVEKVKDYWAQGMRFQEIMEKEGISPEKIKENASNLRLESLKSFLQKLVEKGIITKEQMEKRLEIEKKLMENCENCKFFLHRFGKNGWRW